MAVKRTALSVGQRREWANMGHLFFLDALMSASGLKCHQIAFQGGTSLHLSWGSPRFSEDLDFLLEKDGARVRLMNSMKAVADQIKRQFHALDRGFSIEIKDRTGDAERMLVFELVIGHVAKVGSAKVKTEFWLVPVDYLAHYQVEMRTPMPRSDDVMARIQSNQPLPSAKLTSILADKIVAMAYRERVKWRDIFDAWWLAEQMERRFPDRTFAEVAEQAKQHALAYEGPGLEVGLHGFLARKQDLMAGVGCDLDRWLPESLARVLLPDMIPEMSATALGMARSVLECLQGEPQACARRVSRGVGL